MKNKNKKIIKRKPRIGKRIRRLVINKLYKDYSSSGDVAFIDSCKLVFNSNKIEKEIVNYCDYCGIEHSIIIYYDEDY